MFEAYVVSEIASKLEKSIEIVSLAADNLAKKVFLGSKAGHLLSLSALHGGRRGYDLVMCRSFEKRAVTDLEIVSQYGIILCLSDNQLSVHDITEPFGLKTSLSDLKPITSFSSHINEEDGLLYVAVAARKKVLIYKWLANDFLNISLEISPSYFPDNAQKVLWCGPLIALAVMDEYYYFQVTLPPNEMVEVQKLFGVGQRTGEPLIVNFPEEGLVAYCRDNYLVFQDYDGSASSAPKIKFSDLPVEIVYDAPFVIALLPKGKVEIRSIRPPLHIQTLQLNRAVLLAKGIPGTVYTGSNGDVWFLDSHPRMKENVERLIRDKQLELAIRLAEKCQEIDKDGVIEIKRKAAFDLFCQRKFDEWLEMHAEVKTDVMTVIAHFPRLLDASYRDSLNSLLDDALPEFAENECKSGLLALARYLAAVRTDHAKAIAKYRRKSFGELSAAEKKNFVHHENVLQVVDTTLLKCYIQANESLVASLIRLPNNMCILADSEKILLEKEKFYELFLLYEKRGLHEKALTLLKKHAHDVDSPLFGCDLTVRYLQHLGNAYIELIFSFASWVLWDDLNTGLSIFTCDDDNVRDLDRDRVLEYLTRERVAAIIPYLEHLIFYWKEERPKFHEALGLQYVLLVRKLMKEYMCTLKEGESIVRAGEEEGDLGIYRQKLAHFLQSSSSYSPRKLVPYLSQDCLYEELALVHGHMKNHEQALAIYTTVLKDYRAAEEYCLTHYDRTDSENSKVWVLLLRMYMYPPDASVLGILQREMLSSEPNQSEAMRILKDHASSIDTVEAMSLLPPDFYLKSIWNALKAVLQSAHDKRTSIRLHKSVCDAAFVHCRDSLVSMQSICFSLDDTSECCSCGKKVVNWSFIRYPDGRIEHFHCFNKR